MGIATLAELKAYLGIASSSEDAILTTTLSASQRWIETITDRYFEPVSGIRYFSFENPKEIFLDQDLLALASLKLDDETIDSSDIELHPRNSERKIWIKLLSAYYPTSENPVWSVNGTWGYSLTVPEDVKMACLRLAAYMYRQKDAQVFDVTAMPDVGQMTIPQGIPKDVQIIVKSYRRVW
jgi:hypothetical protein